MYKKYTVPYEMMEPESYEGLFQASTDKKFLHDSTDLKIPIIAPP